MKVERESQDEAFCQRPQSKAVERRIWHLVCGDPHFSESPFLLLPLHLYHRWHIGPTAGMSWLRVLGLNLPTWIRIPTRATARHVLYGIILGFSLSLTSTSLALYYQSRKRERIAAQFAARPIELRSDEILSGVTGLIGNTPLVRINSLSNALGVEILGKAEVRPIVLCGEC